MMAGAYRTVAVRPTRPPGPAISRLWRVGRRGAPWEEDGQTHVTAQDPELIAGAEPSGALNGMAEEVRGASQPGAGGGRLGVR